MIVLDGPNILWRAHYGSPDLTRSDGHLSGALNTSLFMLANFHKAFDRQPLVIAWDGPDSWRKNVYPPYKANRVATDEQKALRKQVYEQQDVLKQILKCIGVAQVEHPNTPAQSSASMFGCSTCATPMHFKICLRTCCCS